MEQQRLLLLQARSALDQGLLDSASALAHLALCDQESLEGLALLGEVCLAKGEHRRALHFLVRAQQLQELQWSWGAAGATAAGTQQHDAESAAEASAVLELLRLIAECHERLGEEREAMAVLERIPLRRRSPRVWCMLGRLYGRTNGLRSPAVAAYKACLRQYPCAVEAALALAELRVPASEICELLEPIDSSTAIATLCPTHPVPAAAAVAAAAAAGERGGRAALEQQEGDVCAADMAVDDAHHLLPLQQQPAEAAWGSGIVANAAPLPAQQQWQPMAAAPRSGAFMHAWLHPKGLVRGESAREHELVPDTATAAWTPLGSPVAVAAFSPGTSGQATPAPAASPDLQQHQQQQQQDGPCQLGSSRFGSGTRQPPAVRRMLRLRSQDSSDPAPAASPLHVHSATLLQQANGGSGAGTASAHQALALEQRLEQQSYEQQAGALPLHGSQPEASALPAAAATGMLDASWFSLEFVGRMVEAQAALAAEDKQCALQAGEQLLATVPRHPHALALAALCQANHGSATSALMLLGRACQLDPYSLTGTDRYAELLCMRGDGMALAELAYACMETGQQAQRPEPWLVAAAAKEQAGDVYEAVGLARKALERDAACVEAHLCIGRLLQRMGGTTASAAGLAECKEALHLRSSFRAYRAAVEAVLAGDMAGEAYRLARQARAVFPCSQACHVLLAKAMAAQPAKLEDAEAVLSSVLDQDPECEEAALVLADVLVKQGLLEEAKEVLEQQLQTAPSEALHVALARRQLAGGQIEEALRHFHAALGFNTHSLAAARGLREVDHVLGPSQEAEDDESLKVPEGMAEDYGGGEASASPHGFGH